MIEVKDEKYYTLREIANMFNMHINTIRRYIKEGRLIGYKVGRSILVTEDDLNNFIKGKNNAD